MCFSPVYGIPVCVFACSLGVKCQGHSQSLYIVLNIVCKL